MDKYSLVSIDKYAIGECPIWDYVRYKVLWTDIANGHLFEYSPNSGAIKTISGGVNVTGFSLHEKGLVCASDSGLYFFGDNGFSQLAREFDGEKLSCNDVIADPMGRFLFGTIYYNESKDYPLGKLYKMDCDGQISVLDEGFHHVNGLGFSPDNKTLYFTDTAVRKIYAYDYDQITGRVKNRRIFVSVPSSEGIPDGLTVDSQGHVWSAQWYGGVVVRYDPDGKKHRCVKVPQMQVSCLAFCGDDLTDIYVTTAAKNVRLKIAPPGYNYNAPNIGGHVFKYNLGIAGKREYIAKTDINLIKTRKR